MDTGTKISGFAHLGLIGAALFGGLFQGAPPTFEVRDVTVVSSEQFAALIAAQRPPDTAVVPDAPTAPEPDSQTPTIATPTPEPEIVQDPPQSTAAPEPEAVPDTLPEPLPPETEATDTAPTIQPPDPVDTPLPPAAVASPEPRPVERVAPRPVAAPPEATRPDDIARPDTSSDNGAEAPKPQEDATAPPEATDRITPDANTHVSRLAPAASVRPPKRRPAAPARPSATETPSTQDAVNAALTEALGGSDGDTAAPAVSGPPLTDGEKSDLVVAVSRCWNVGSLSSAALETTVVVGVQMTEQGQPVTSSIRLLSHSGGSDQSADQAFQAARRAIIRCGAKGYDLPVEKYGQWRDIEMTFNPERMRIR